MYYANEDYEEMIQDLLPTDQLNKEDFQWLDQRSTKKRFRYSEKKKIEELFLKVFGKLPRT